MSALFVDLVGYLHSGQGLALPGQHRDNTPWKRVDESGARNQHMHAPGRS